MPLRISYACHECLTDVRWIYDETENELKSDAVRGCRGEGCTEVHHIEVMEVDEDTTSV